MTTRRTLPVLLTAAALALSASAGSLDGTVKFGGIAVDETGDRTVMQETYNLFDGFSIHQIYINGVSDSRDHLVLDLREVNLDSRKGNLLYRRPGLLKLTGSYDENWQVFTPDASTTSRRRDWKFGAHVTPTKWLGLSGNVNYLTREGDRISYPEGTNSVLGSGYDNALTTGRLAASLQHGSIGGAVAYDVSDFSDDLSTATARSGQVVSARFHASGIFYDKLSHMLRASYGTRELSNNTLEYTLKSFRYTGIVAPVRAFELKYAFDANRIEDESTALQTDRFQNGADATVFHKFGQVSAGYVYETNDDDRTLTAYHGWRAGTILRYDRYVTAKFDYAGRTKKDEEELTLLKDVESSRIRARLQVQPVDGLALGGGFSRREREFTDIQVEAEGDVANAFVRYAYPSWGSISADYTYTDDSYTDLIAGFETTSDVVTGRFEFDRIRDLRLGVGATFLDVSGDLDIEKAMAFVEAGYTLQGKYHLDLKYNAYNYDDFILVDRYYTANVMWFSLGYDFNLR